MFGIESIVRLSSASFRVLRRLSQRTPGSFPRSKKHKRGRSPAIAQRALSCEPLENRTLLSVFTYTPAGITNPVWAPNDHSMLDWKDEFGNQTYWRNGNTAKFPAAAGTVTIAECAAENSLIYATQITIDDGASYSFVAQTSSDKLQIPAMGTAIVLGPNGTSASATISASVVSATSATAVTLSAGTGGGTFAIAASTPVTVGTLTASSGTLDVEGTLTISGDGTAGHGLTIMGTGVLMGTNPTATIALGANCSLTYQSSDTTSSFAGIVSGTGDALYVNAGTGVLSLGGLNTYTGGTFLTSGTLNVSQDAALGTAPTPATTNITFNGDLGAGFLPTAINNTGWVGGLATQTSHAAIYSISSGLVSDIGTLGGATSQVEAISDTGFVVGYSDTPASSHGFLNDLRTAQMTDLGNIASPAWGSAALGVNDLGQVVGGYSLDANSVQNRAFIYTKVDGMEDLNDFIDPTSGFQLRSATGINDLGEIAASGFNAQGQYHAFLLTPVPEPTTFKLTIIVFCILGGMLASSSLLNRTRVPSGTRFNGLLSDSRVGPELYTLHAKVYSSGWTVLRRLRRGRTRAGVIDSKE
jgi:probable HAF family extracellular repeat protein/autotransporter-associated beta strand protein